MRLVPTYSLWIGNAGDARRVAGLIELGIVAVVDLAANEPVASLPREFIYCRFPLLDGVGNESGMLRSAIETISGMLRNNVPTLVACSAGMSRSPALAAAAISRLNHRDANECLLECIEGGAADVSPGLWNDILKVMS